MRILLLTYHYPPDPAVGAIRAGNVVRTLEARGHDVTVIAAGEPGAADPRVHRVRPLPNVTQLYRRSRGRGHGSGARGGGGSGGAVEKPRRPLPWWKRLALSLLLLPDENQGFVVPAVRLGRRLARERYDLLFSTAPPHAVTVSALALKLLTGLPWVAELRDPWTDNAIVPPYHTRLRAAILRLLERISLGSADAAIPVTSAAADLLRERTDPSKVRLVRNGVPDPHVPDAPAPRRAGEPFRILHAGTLYGSRDPRPLIAAVAALRHDAGTQLPHSIQIDLVGNCAWYEPLIREAAEQLAAGDRVVMHGTVDPDESARMTARADLLLLLARNQPLQVPQKLYDYLAARRPILAFIDAEGESARMLREVGGHWLVESDSVERTRAVLEAAIAAGDRPFETDEGIIRSWSVSAQMERLAETVEAVAASRS